MPDDGEHKSVRVKALEKIWGFLFNNIESINLLVLIGTRHPNPLPASGARGAYSYPLNQKAKSLYTTVT